MSHHITARAAGRTIVTVAFGAAAALILTACSSSDEPTPAGPSASPTAQAQTQADPAAQLLAEHDLDGLDAREVIDSLDALPVAQRPTTLMASIRPNELLLSDDQARETALAMPADEFYVSLAPYVNQTHDCYFHSLTTCKGELQNVDVHVLVTDKATGEILVDETRTTFDNGFMGLWLPRDIDASITIEYDGKSATSDLSTSNDDDATCVTTMQLA
ncbi:CueP family metal-binding protein [Demequina sp. TTPB684]|uniref:CueP family metal-binding protein n=1 Tax=unclassified Demequina TaxID=2620311 RepID=UPI001CF3EF55|nr:MULTISPECIES: CueP family metal-binding protein [unclassified Demequina]MCB2412498.1 CueP family metal-binding protein [Demequina sp. TTPB684]UPU88797.1 CueP family metal-binding protein [Demequina sp. TMPB413]